MSRRFLEKKIASLKKSVWYSGVHPRVTTLIQPSFQKKKLDSEDCLRQLH